MRRVNTFRSDPSQSAIEWGVRPEHNRHQITAEIILAQTAAVGTITLTGIQSVGETITINNLTWEFAVLRTRPFQITIGADAAAMETNIVAAINADYGQSQVHKRGPNKDYVTAVGGAGTTVEVTWHVLGTIGNSVVFTENASNLTMDGSGTLGGTTAGVGDGSAHTPAAGTGTIAYTPHRAVTSEDSTDTFAFTNGQETKTLTGMMDVLKVTPASLDADCAIRIVYNGWKE